MEINKNKIGSKRNLVLTVISLGLLILLIAKSGDWLGTYTERVLTLCAIYSICTISVNLVNGITGVFSLGTAGFMAIGAYTYAILSIPAGMKERLFYVEPMVPWLAKVEVAPVISMVIAGLAAMLVSFLVGFPALRMRGDYLAIVTLGFSEIIRIVINNMQNVTNGPSGLKNIPNIVDIWVAFGVLAFFTTFILMMMKTSYGRALKAIRENEIAAEAMGINLFKHKMIAFVISGFMAGIAGALLASLVTALDPNQFRYILSFNFLLMMVLGGQGSFSGSIAGAFIVTIAQEVLRVVDNPINFGFWKYPGVTGMRMVVFAIALMFILLFWNKGIFGQEEFGWDRLFAKSSKLLKRTRINPKRKDGEA